ncbi:CAP-Gly domain-containing linker protein 2-like isoform X2 [Zootermopsis nevadensis]|nr:CAP-Gly domain-containing linker protein 2-like isoform X2 [Zootermopsis nevadensis]
MTEVGNSCKTKPKTDNYICVAKDNIVAERLDFDINKNVKNKEVDRVIRLGSLVEVISKKHGSEKVAVRLIDERSLDEGSEDVWLCSKFHLLPVDPVMLTSIIAVFEPSLRITLLQNEHIFRELAAIEVGRKVMLLSETQDSSWEPELAVVRYKGPVPEMGHGTYYGLEILVHSTQGKNDGCIFGKRFFYCPNNAGVFVALNRLVPYKNPKVLNLGKSLENSEICSEATAIPSKLSMPSNERRLHQNGGSHDVGNFKTTLVLHLKEKECIPRNNKSLKLEKTEKLIDLDVTGESVDPGNVPLKVGDQVVWILDTQPEQGVVRWLGHLDGHTLKSDLMAGVEFEKPIGNSSGTYKKQQFFHTKKNHGQFIPLMSLVKAEDFFGSPSAGHP